VSGGLLLLVDVSRIDSNSFLVKSVFRVPGRIVVLLP